MQYARVTELVDDAKASGARVAAGGNRTQQRHHRGHLILPSEPLAKLSDFFFFATEFSPNGKDGYFFEPTVLADVQEGVRVVDEEQFGPVIPVLKYTDVEDAMTRANDTDFGLGGSVRPRPSPLCPRW